MQSSKVTGKDIQKMVRDTFDTDKPTPEQLKYVMTMLSPSTYVLANHKIRGHSFTFNIPNRDTTKAQSHRPWQQAILEDQSHSKAVMKSRQLGLTLSSLVQ